MSKTSSKTRPASGNPDSEMSSVGVETHNAFEPLSNLDLLQNELTITGEQTDQNVGQGAGRALSSSTEEEHTTAYMLANEQLEAALSNETRRRGISERHRRHSFSGSDVEDTPTRSGRTVGFDNDPKFVGATTEVRVSEGERPWIPIALRTDKGKGRARSNSVPPVAHTAFRGTGAANESKTPMRGTGAHRFTEVVDKPAISTTHTFQDLAQASGGSSGSDSSSSSSDSSDKSSSGDEWTPAPKNSVSPQNNATPTYAPFSVIPNTKQGKRGVKALAKMSEKDHYSGDDKDPEALARWVRKILMNMLTAGVHADCFAVVSYISQCLSGDADIWFSKHVIDQIQYVYPSDKAWSIASPFPLKRIVKNLKDRFVSTTFNRDAQYKWSRLSQTDSKGHVVMTVSALALRIEEVAEQKYLTSEYEMKVRFTEAMIAEIANIVLVKCEIESKRLTWAKIVRVAIKAERSYNQKVATDFARQSGMRISNYEVATNSGAVQKMMRKNANNANKDSPTNNSSRSDRSNKKRDNDRSPLNQNKQEGGERPDRTPASGSNKLATGTPSRYTADQKAMYNERRDKGECYVCGSSDHLAKHHEGGNLGYMADATDSEESFTGDILSTDDDFEYESDFGGYESIHSDVERQGQHIFEFAPEFLETMATEPRAATKHETKNSRPRIRDVSGFTDSEYESDDPATHELRNALIISDLEALELRQKAPYEPLLQNAKDQVPFEASRAWEEKRVAQDEWAATSTPHDTLGYMQEGISEDLPEFHRPSSSQLPELLNKHAVASLLDEVSADSGSDTEEENSEDTVAAGARMFEKQYELPYHPAGANAGFCLIKHQSDRDTYWGWAMSKNDIASHLRDVVKDHKGLYKIRVDSNGECSDDGNSAIAEHSCSRHCLFNSQWALIAGVPLQGMQVLSPNDTFRHRISLSHTEAPSSFEADADRLAAMGHPIKLGIDDLSDRLPITPDLVFDIKLHGKSGFKAFIDTGSDNSLIAPYLARTLKAHIRAYLTPKVLRLGTKGSHAMINSYCFLDMELAGIKKVQRFDIANVFTDCVIGRDVLRTHACSIEFGPDRLVARDIVGTKPQEKGKGRKNEPLSFCYMQPAPATAPSQSRVSENPHYQRAYDPDTPVWDPRHLEKGAFRPTLTSKLRKNGTAFGVEADDYQPSPEEIEEFHAWCSSEFKEAFIADEDTLPLPPLRPVQHEIPYIDESDPPRPRRNYKIPDKFMEKWNELHEKHIAAGIWIPMQTRNADPIMPVIKKDGKLRSTVDLRARNANTIKMSCPPLETDFLRNTLAAHKFHVELDVKGCFQQLWIRPADVWKTVFSTIRGTYGTLSAQQGDPNSVVTQLAMLSYMFWDQIGKIVVNYADNLFVYANSWREVKLRTIEVLVRARLHQFCMNINSFRVCPKWVEVLGMRIRHGEIRMDEGKRDAIALMNAPHDKKLLQRFIGSVEWLARFIPHLAEVASPLTELTGNAAWSWSTAQHLAFEEIKRIVDEDR
ncbi:hypothetical protein P7C70_g5150, partial [Phenoliferia sp. Uapishka_3]